MKNIGLLLILGAAGYFLMGNKKGTSSTSTTTPDKSLMGTREYPGYKIVDCNELVVTDTQLARNYATQIGMKLKTPSDASKALFESAKCVDNLKIGIDAFYDLFIYLVLGMDIANKANNINANLITISKIAEGLSKKFNIKLSVPTKEEYLKEMINTKLSPYREFPGYVIVNCKHILIINKKEAHKYAYDIGKEYGNNFDMYIEYMLGLCPIEKLTSGLEEFYDLYVYSMAGKLKGDKSGATELAKILTDYANDIKKDGVNVIPPTPQDIINIINTYK